MGIITDRADFAETYQNLVSINESQVLVVSPPESDSTAEIITQWVQERAHIGQPPRQLVTFQEFLSMTEAVYDGVLLPQG